MKSPRTLTPTSRPGHASLYSPVPAAPRKLVYTVEEVAALLGVGETTVRVAIRAGRFEFPVRSVMSRVVIPCAPVDAFLAGEES